MLWLTRLTLLNVKRTRAALALALTLIAAVACADRVPTAPHKAATQRASTDINPSPIDDLWISPYRRVTSGETATGYLTLANPPAAGTQVILTPGHPNAYVSLDTILIWPGGNTASFLVRTVAEPYQLGVMTYAIVGGQWYNGKGFTLLANVAPPPPDTSRKISVSPGSLTFGPQAAGTSSAAQNVTVSNTGTGPVWMGSITVSGPFSLSNGCPNMTLYPAYSCLLSVRYAPTTSAGAQTGWLVIQTGAPSSPDSVRLTGTPTPSISVTPTAIGWGSVALGNATSGRVIKITSSGTAPLVVSSLTLGGTNPGDFPIYTDGCTGATLTPGTSCTAYVSFEPLAIGARSAKITIAHNASTGPVVVSLSGTGVKGSGGYIP